MIVLPRSFLTCLVIILAQDIICDSFLESWIGPSTGPVTNPDHRQDRKQQDPEVIVPPGQNISLECKGEGNLSWFAVNTQQKYIHGNSSRRISATFKNPPRRVILNILDATIEDIGRYVCMSNDEELYDVYVYVFDTNMCNQPLLVPTVNYQVSVEPGHEMIIPCRAVHPKVNVTLERSLESDEDVSVYDPRIGFKIREAWHINNGPWECQASYNNCRRDEVVYTIWVTGQEDEWVTTPQISGSKELHKALGDSACLECAVNSTVTVSMDLFWRLPNHQRATISGGFDIQRTEKHSERKSGIRVTTTRLLLYINDLRDQDFGTYSCVVQRQNYDKALPMIDNINLLRGEGDFVSLKVDNKDIYGKLNDIVTWAIKYHSKRSEIEFNWISPRGTLLSKNFTTKGRFRKRKDDLLKQVVLQIANVSADDAGTYILQGIAGTASTSINLTLVVQYIPIVKINGTQGYLKANTNPALTCLVNANPSGNISWSFRPCKDIQECSITGTPQKDPYTIPGSSVNFFANQSAKLSCRACNSLGCQTDRAFAIVSDVDKGEVFQAPEEVLIGDSVTMRCIFPKFNCSSDIFWRIQLPGASETKLLSNEDKAVKIISSETAYSWLSSVNISSVQRKHAGLYICLAASCNLGSERTQSYQLDPLVAKKPTFESQLPEKQNIEVKEGATNFKFDCEAHGRPTPRIIWTKDGEEVQTDLGKNNTSRFTLQPGNMTLVISSVLSEDEGEFQCKLMNYAGQIRRRFIVDVKQSRARKQISAALVIPIIILCVLLLGAVVYLARRVKREKKKVRTLTAQDVKIFLEGAAESIDPDLGLDQQADLLPYNEDYEYPREHLKLGRQLGAGAFGRVLRGEAEAPLFGSDTTAEDGGEKPAGPTIVAVKMVKPHAELTHLKALMTELKILIHVGKHLNVVNLLGACTTNLANKELLVIVEYCRFGNLHSFLLRQRDDFLDQVDHLRDVFDFSIGSKSEPGRYQNLPMETAEHDRQVAFSEDMKTITYEPSPHYAVPGQDMSKSVTTDSTGAMSEHWTPKYRGDFKSSEISRVSTKDLVCWSYQVARGMEYLASRQVVHADLAARNLLLADNNVVKICDFGLARNLYKDANYLKKGDDPLPVKWMAIESIRDRVFSTQSDVWSFGIVLWEFFTLAMQPYPGIPLDANFLPSLLNGYRMEKPQYCTLYLYRIIKSCWNERPDERPNFTQLVADFGHILDENVKQLYLELNGPYTRMNSLQQEYQHMVRNSRMSKPQAIDVAAKSQPLQHTRAMNDYQFPVPSLRKVSIKDKQEESDAVEPVNEIHTEKSASGYINLSADVTDIKERNSDVSLVIEDTPQGYMRMSPSTSKANKSPASPNLITEL